MPGPRRPSPWASPIGRAPGGIAPAIYNLPRRSRSSDPHYVGGRHGNSARRTYRCRCPHHGWQHVEASSVFPRPLTEHGDLFMLEVSGSRSMRASS